MQQFESVNCSRGAPMGRSEYGNACEVSDKRIHLFRVNLVDGDYDDGGAYWGGGRGTKPLYCARTGDGCTYRAFVRANSRKEAIQLLEIPENKLMHK